MSFLTTSIGFGVAAEEDAVWEDACALAGASERGNDMEEVGIVALAGGRRAEGFEALIGVVGQVDAVGPALIAEGRIGDDLSKVLRVSPALNGGFARVLPCSMTAVGALCRATPSRIPNSRSATPSKP